MEPVRLSVLAAEVGLALEGQSDPLITGAAGIEEAGPGDITFLHRKELRHHLQGTKAAAVILEPGVDCPVPVLRSDNPYLAFARILGRFATPLAEVFPPGIHPSAVLDPAAQVPDSVSVGPGTVVGAGATIGPECRLGPNVVIEPNVQIGPRCLLYAQVTVREGCCLGEGVILHPGAVIGSDGFGYLPGGDGFLKIPQVGIVVLEEGVEVGANSCVDRATTGITTVRAGTKIDNQVQVGHNVAIGRNCVISAQTGISGSCTLGDGVQIGGQAGLADHVRIGDEVKIGAKTGIPKDVPAGQSVFWYPAFEAKEAFRLIAHLRKLPVMAVRLRELEKALRASGRSGEDPEC